MPKFRVGRGAHDGFRGSPCQWVVGCVFCVCSWVPPALSRRLLSAVVDSPASQRQSRGGGRIRKSNHSVAAVAEEGIARSSPWRLGPAFASLLADSGRWLAAPAPASRVFLLAIGGGLSAGPSWQAGFFLSKARSRLGEHEAALTRTSEAAGGLVAQGRPRPGSKVCFAHLRQAASCRLTFCCATGSSSASEQQQQPGAQPRVVVSGSG